MGDKTNYNEDELNAPEWMNKEFFEKVLQNAESTKANLLDYSINPGTSKSDHYATVMFRAKLKYSLNGIEKSRSFIIKSEPKENSTKSELLGESAMFETEIKMYTETLPKIEALLRQHGYNEKLHARAHYCRLEKPKCIVFEDLVEEGYVALSNRDCTLEEVKTAFNRLAKIHAITYKLAQEGDSSIVSYDKGSFNTLDFETNEFVNSAIKNFKEVISTQDDLLQFIPHIERVEKDLLKDSVAMYDEYSKGPQRKGIFVLNHGDFHMKNLMVKHEEGQFKDLILLDYQFCIFGSPAIDVLYSFGMLMSPDMRLNHRDELLHGYFKDFQRVLKQLNFKGHIPSLEEFEQELHKYKHWELFVFMGFLILNYTFRDGEGDLAKLIEDPEYRKKIYNNPEMVEEIRHIMPRFVKEKYFE